jgi:uncharacterized membrane protein
MERYKVAYAGYIAILAVFVGIIFITPILAASQDMGGVYKALAFTCHQKISRSICIFTDGRIADCLAQNGTFVTGSSDRTAIEVHEDSIAGFKMPVCARDVGLYVAMLIGGLAYPFLRKLDSTTLYPAVFLVIAIVPLGIDGTVQLVSELGFLPFVYESSNLIRLLTGIIAGFAASMYAVPLIVGIAMASEGSPQAKDAKKR